MDYFKSIMKKEPILFDIKYELPKEAEGINIGRL